MSDLHALHHSRQMMRQNYDDYEKMYKWKPFARKTALIAFLILLVGICLIIASFIVSVDYLLFTGILCAGLGLYAFFGLYAFLEYKFLNLKNEHFD